LVFYNNYIGENVQNQSRFKLKKGETPVQAEKRRTPVQDEKGETPVQAEKRRNPGSS